MNRRQLLVSLGSTAIVASTAQLACGQAMPPDKLNELLQRALATIPPEKVSAKGIWSVRSKPEGLNSRRVFGQAGFMQGTIGVVVGVVSVHWTVHERGGQTTGGVITELMADGNSSTRDCVAAYVTLQKDFEIAQGYFIVSS